MWNQNVAYNNMHGYHGQRDNRRPSYTPGNWMNWMNRLIKETNVDVDSIAASTSAPRSTTRRGNSRSRRTCVTTSLVGIAFVLLLLGVSCVPLVLYFVEKDQYKYYKADASITFQGTYNESLGDLSTQTSIDFQQDFCRVMEQTQAKKFKETYSGCLVTQIKNGSVIVEFTMYYYAKVTVQSDEVKSEITIYLKTNLTTTFTSKFNITVDVNSLTLSMLQTGEKDYKSGTSDVRYKTSLLTLKTENTPSTLVSTISSNADNATTEVTTILSESTVTLPHAVNTTVPLETTTTDTPAITTTVPPETTTIVTPASTTTVPPETTNIDTQALMTTVPPETTTTDTPTTTTTAPPETTTTDTPTTTTTAPPETTTTDTPASTTTVPLETTTTDTPTTTTTAPPEITTTDTPTTTTTVPPETTTTDTPTTTTTVPPETTTTDTPTTTTIAPPETTTTDAPVSATTAPLETTTTDTLTTTTTVSSDTTATTATTNSPTSETSVLTDTNTNYPPTSTETFSDTTITHSLTTTTFINTSSDNDTTTSTTTTTSTKATTISAEPFAVVVMKNSIGEIGKQAYIPCTINITSGDWVMIYIYQTHNGSTEPKIATISKNETITVFTSDPLLMPTFNISGSQIEVVVTFNFSNFDSSKCSMRLYSFTCSVEMTTSNTFNASAEFNLIAPLTQPTVILHGTRFMFNEMANVSLAAINATCNTSRDRSSDIASTIAMRIENASGADITSFLNVTSYNISTETCGELVFIQWSEVFSYRSDLNGSKLTCYVQTNTKTVISESVTLTFLEQQNPTVSSTENPAITNPTNADTTLTTTQPDISTKYLQYTSNYTQPSSTVTASQGTTNKTSTSDVIVTTSFDTSTETFLNTTTNNPTIIESTEIFTTTTQVLSQPHAVVVMKNSIGEIGKQAYIPCTINIASGDWSMLYIYQTHNDSIDPKIATFSNNDTKTVFTRDPLLMTTFNISGSQIEAVVTFNFSNYDFSNCSVRLYRFTCSLEMTTGSTFNASAEFNLIAPLLQPTVTLHKTQLIFNEAANVSLAGINATCNATKDRSSDITFTIAMRIQNVSGDDIDSFANVTSYNVFTETCGELVFINWSEVLFTERT